MNTIFTITKLTFREAIRRKIVIAALLLGAAFLIIYSLGFHYIKVDMDRFSRPGVGDMARANGLNMILLAGMYVVNFLCIAIAALITADGLAGEIQSGTIQAVVTKPVRRSEVVLGKWLGYAGLVLTYLMFMGGGVLLSVWLQAQYSAPNWLAGLLLIFFNTLIVMSLTLAFSSTLSTLATGGAVFGAYGLAFIGGWVERIGTLFNNQTAVNLGIISSLLLPSEALWSKAGTLMTPPLVNIIGLNPFTSTNEPSPLMLGYAGLYLLGAVAVAIRQFGKRDL